MKKLIIALLVLCLAFGAVLSVRAMNNPAVSEAPVVTQIAEEAAVPAPDAETAVEAPAEAAAAPEAISVKTLDYAALRALYDDEEVVMAIDGKDVKWKEYFSWLYNGCVEVEGYMQNYAMYGMQMNWTDPMSDDPEDTVARYPAQSAESVLCELSAVEGYCEAKGVELSEEAREQMKAELKEAIEATCGEDGTEEEFYDMLATRNMDKTSYERMMNANYLLRDGLNVLYGKDGADISDEQAQEYLDESGYMRSNHILFLTKDMNTGEALDEAAIAEKKAQADGIYEELITIKDPDKLLARFKELKEKYCEDSGKTAYPDGYTFLPGQMVSAFEETTLALEDYAVSKPVESEYGYHIILRLPLTVDDVLTTSQEGVALTARALCANELYLNGLDEYRDGLKIEYKNGFESPDLTKFIVE